jgi:hypothetical protein
MKASEALIAWTPSQFKDSPTRGRVQIGTLLRASDPDWTGPFVYTGGAAEVGRRDLIGDRSALKTFIDFATMVVRDGIDPQVAHVAFLSIDEYAQHIAPDIYGARESRRDSRNGERA